MITAPRDGMLISRNVERGNIVQPSIGADDAVAVRRYSARRADRRKEPGSDRARPEGASLGRRVSKETFAAEVVYINPGIDLQTASVEVKLRVPRAAGLSAAGYDGLGRHRNGLARRRADHRAAR